MSINERGLAERNPTSATIARKLGNDDHQRRHQASIHGPHLATNHIALQPSKRLHTPSGCISNSAVVTSPNPRIAVTGSSIRPPVPHW